MSNAAMNHGTWRRTAYRVLVVVPVVLGFGAVLSVAITRAAPLELPFQLPFGAPSVKGALDGIGPGWGMAFIVDETLFFQTGADPLIAIYAPGETDTDLNVGYLWPEYNALTGAFSLTVVDRMLIDTGAGSVGDDGTTLLHLEWVLAPLDGSEPQPRADTCKCTLNGASAEARCDGPNETAVCICSSILTASTCVETAAKKLDE